MPRPPIEFTDAALEDIRYRVEETDESYQSIGDSHRLSQTKIRNMAKEHGWTPRKHRTKRDVPAGPDVLQAANAALRATAAATVAQRCADASVQAGPPAAEPEAASSAERVERMLVEELSAVESMRLQARPCSINETERMTRALERLTEALFKVHRLHSLQKTGAGPDDFDDMPIDADEFRHALAQRIETFIRNWTARTVSESGEDVGAGLA